MEQALLHTGATGQATETGIIVQLVVIYIYIDV